MKQKKAEQEEHLQWLEKKLQAEQEKQERLDTFELNSKRVVVNGSSTQICLETINEQIQNIAQKKDTLCRRMYN